MTTTMIRVKRRATLHKKCSQCHTVDATVSAIRVQKDRGRTFRMPVWFCDTCHLEAEQRWS